MKLKTWRRLQVAYNSSWIVYRLNRTPPLYQPLSIQNPWRPCLLGGTVNPLALTVPRPSLVCKLLSVQIGTLCLYVCGSISLLERSAVEVTAIHSSLLCQREDCRNGCLLLCGYKIPGDFGPVISLWRFIMCSRDRSVQ